MLSQTGTLKELNEGLVSLQLCTVSTAVVDSLDELFVDDVPFPSGQKISAEKALESLVVAVCLARSGVQLVTIAPDTLSVLWLVVVFLLF